MPRDSETRLLATDQQRSVLNVIVSNQPHPRAYTPYGHQPLGNGLLSQLGFNGEPPDSVSGWYLLGNGYRPFNPVLMRFNSPDSWSPFGEGGLNAYAYCMGDPVNRSDPTGHMGNPFKGLLNLLGRRSRTTRANQAFDAAIHTPARAPDSAALPGNFEGQGRAALPQSLNVPSLAHRTSATPNQAPPVTVENLISQMTFEVRRHEAILAHNPNMPLTWRNAQQVYHDNNINTLRNQFLRL